MLVGSWAWVWELAKCQAQGITFQAGANSDRHHLFLGVGKEASKKNECECGLRRITFLQESCQVKTKQSKTFARPLLL